jgi:hypothetical protein
MEWKPIPNYEECGFISSTGLVKNLKGEIRKSFVSGSKQLFGFFDHYD